MPARPAPIHPSTHPPIHPPRGLHARRGPKTFPSPLQSHFRPQGLRAGSAARPAVPTQSRASHGAGGRKKAEGRIQGQTAARHRRGGDDGRISTDARIPTLWHGQTYARRRTLRSPGTAAVGNVGPLSKAAASTFLPKRDAKYIPPPSPPSPPPNPRLALLEQKKKPTVNGEGMRRRERKKEESGVVGGGAINK